MSRPTSRPTSAEGIEADAGDVEAVLLRRFVTETIRHLGPLVMSQLQQAGTLSPPVPPFLPTADQQIAIPVPDVTSQEASAVVTPKTPPPLKIPPHHGGPLTDGLSVTVATPQTSPRTDLLQCPTIMSVQTVITTGSAGGSRSPAALLSNVVDTFCRALATAAEDSCDQYQASTRQVDNDNASALTITPPVVTPISHFFGVSLPKVAAKLQQQMSSLTPRGGTAGFSPRPYDSRGSFFAGGGGMLWDNFQTIGANGTTDRQGSLDQMAEGEDPSMSSWLQETYSTVGVSKRLGQGRSSVTVGGHAAKRSVTRMSGFSSAKGTGHDEPPTLDKTAKDQSLQGGAVIRKPINLDTAQDEGAAPNKKVRGLSVGFKEEDMPTETPGGLPDNHSRRSSNTSTNSPTDDANMGDASTTSIEHDPFANVAPLRSPGEDSPLMPKKTLSRRGSQYFRRQSVTPSVSGGESPASGGATTFTAAQTLNPTDLIKIRLDSLAVPWLDVDNVDFDIFDTCEKINRGELTLHSSNSIHGVAPTNSHHPPLDADHVFRYVCVNVMLRYSFVDTLKIDLKKLYAFLAAVEKLYNPENPYHNAVHAADVLQTSHIYLLNNNVYENFFDREILCLLLSALVHDVGHLGVNNQFLVKTHHPLAVLYNGLSPLENMHSLLAFRLLEQDELNFLHGSDAWSSEDYEDLEAKVVEMVIATDMKFHSNAVSIAQDLFKEGFSVEDGDIDKVIKLIIHAADLSNPMKPRAVYQQWAERVIAEFFSQGAAEEARGLPISPNFNRELMKFPEMQVGFINFVVKPYATAMSPILPPEWLERLQSNLEFMQGSVGKPYDRRDVILAACEGPWVDRWSRVAPVVFNSATASPLPNSPTKSEMSTLSSNPSASLTAGKSPTSDTITSAVATTLTPSSNQNNPPLPRPGSSISMAPVVSLLTDAQIRFCMNAYDSTQALIQRATTAHSENRLGDKLALTDHQRGFAVAIVKLLVKAYEQISSTRRCFVGRAASLMHRVLDEIYGLLVPVVQRSPMATDVAFVQQHQADGAVDGDHIDREIVQMRRLLREPNACLKLFKTVWVVGFASKSFEGTRLPPLSPKERDVYRETVRQCVNTYACVLDGLIRGASGAASIAPLISQQQLFTQRNVIGPLGMPPATPPLVDGRGRGLYASAALAFGNTAALAGISRAASVEPSTGDSIVVVPPSGRFSAPLVSPPLAAIPKHNAVSSKSPPTDDPMPNATPYLTDHRKTLPPLPFIDRGTPDPQTSGSTSPQRSGGSRIPLVTLEPIDGYTNQLETYGTGPASDDEYDRDEDDDVSDGDEPPQGLKQVERVAQLHFQQSDEQWRMTQTDDGSPRSLGLASMGSFSNSKHLRAAPPAPKDEGTAEMGNSSTSHTSANPNVAAAHRPPDMPPVSITAGIPNAYFLPPGSPHSIGQGLRPQSPPTAHGSPNSGYLNVSYSHHPSALGASMDALSFIPMVHSVDPSPRARIGAQSSPPPIMSLESIHHVVPTTAQQTLNAITGAANNSGAARQSPPPPPEVVNIVDAHNLMQLELLLLHHTTHSAAVRNSSQQGGPGPLDHNQSGARRRHSPTGGTDYLSTSNANASDPSNQSTSSGQHTRSSAASTSRSEHPHSRPGQASSPVPDGSPRANRSMSPENTMRLVEDGDLPPHRTTSMQSITEHLQRAAASLTETPLPPIHEGSLSIATVFSSPPPAALSHSPKRRGRGRNAAAGAESPLNSPAYRQQLSDMILNGIESRTFGDSTTGGGSRGVTPSLAAASSSAVLPSVTPVQQHSIDEGCLVPEVYRSAAQSFRNQSAHGSFRNGAGGSTSHAAHIIR